MTVEFPFLQETEWVWGTVQGHRPQLGFVRQGLTPFSSARGIAPESGTPCPRSSLRKQIQAGLQELSACHGSWEVLEEQRRSVGPHPPSLAVLQNAELSLGPMVGGGAERIVTLPAPHSPSSGFCLETICAASERPPQPPPLTPLSRPHPLGTTLPGRSRQGPLPFVGA